MGFGHRAHASRLAAVVATTLLAAPLTGLAGSETASAASFPGYAVRVSTTTFVDTTRGTPARQGVPASPTRTIHELIYDPVGPAGPLPTVMFAPGWDNLSLTYGPLLQAIASAGYLVVGVDSPGTSSYFPGTPLGADIDNNTLDLTAALDNVEAGPLGGRVDRFAVAAMGHSDGGSVVANLALNSAFVSNRFNAYVVLTGGIPFGAGPGTFGPRNNGPVLVMIGTKDEFGNYTPEPGGGGTELVYNTAGSSRALVTMTGATHFSAYIGTSAQAYDTRAAIVNFLNGAEKHIASAEATFNIEAATDGLSAQENFSLPWFLQPTVVGMAPTADGKGYWVASNNGTVWNFGDAAPLGGVSRLSSPVVAIAGTPDGGGYWLVTKAGSVFPVGDATYHGSLAVEHLAAPIVGMAADPATGGYWLLGGDGGVFSFDAPFFGSTGNIRLNAPAVGMTATADGNGYFFVASDGGIFTYGDARFQGSMGGRHLNRPVVGMTVDATTGGYWLDASDGGIFAFDAPFEGSTGGVRLAQPCVSMAAYLAGPGYRLVAADGGIFSFNAPFEGSGPSEGA
jgi:Chlorophyllase enzyme